METQTGQGENVIPLSMVVLDTHDGLDDQANMVVARLDRYFSEYDNEAKDGKILIPSYLTAQINESPEKDGTSQRLQEAGRQSGVHAATGQQSGNTFVAEFRPQSTSDNGDVEPAIASEYKLQSRRNTSITNLVCDGESQQKKVRKRKRPGSSVEIMEELFSGIGNSVGMKTKKPLTSKKTPDKKTTKKGRSLQDCTQMSFVLPQETPFHKALAKTAVEPWAKTYSTSIQNSIDKLSSPTVFRDFKAKLEGMLSQKSDHEKLIPKGVIKAMLVKYNNETKQALQRSFVEKDIRHFMHMSCQNHQTNSKEYWSSCDHNMNFIPPAQPPASLDPTDSQRAEYQKLIASIESKRKVIHDVHSKLIDNYKRKIKGDR